MVASPLTGLAGALGGLIGGLARQLQQIADQGLVGGDAPAPPAAAARAGGGPGRRGPPASRAGRNDFRGAGSRSGPGPRTD